MDNEKRENVGVTLSRVDCCCTMQDLYVENEKPSHFVYCMSYLSCKDVPMVLILPFNFNPLQAYCCPHFNPYSDCRSQYVSSLCLSFFSAILYMSL